MIKLLLLSTLAALASAAPSVGVAYAAPSSISSAYASLSPEYANTAKVASPVALPLAYAAPGFSLFGSSAPTAVPAPASVGFPSTHGGPTTAGGSQLVYPNNPYPGGPVYPTAFPQPHYPGGSAYPSPQPGYPSPQPGYHGNHGPAIAIPDPVYPQGSGSHYHQRPVGQVPSYVTYAPQHQFLI